MFGQKPYKGTAFSVPTSDKSVLERLENMKIEDDVAAVPVEKRPSALTRAVYPMTRLLRYLKFKQIEFKQSIDAKADK